MASATAAVRIPAWQRLGLKLKSTQGSEETFERPAISESPKRKTIDSIDLPQSKKAKKDIENRPLTTTTVEPVTPNLSRKKSVTFTPETKIEDGDSIKQLFSAWVAEQRSQDPSFQPKSSQVFDTPEPPKVEEHIDTTLDEKERRVKRAKGPEESLSQSKDTKTKKPKKPKSPKASKVTNSPDTPTRPFLEYLKQYHNCRESWKFNKNHQNHLLKNIFNIEVIPSDYAHLIYEYVRGLQGGVRTRLRDASLAVKVKDQEDGAAGFPETMSDRDKKQMEYDVAIKEYVATMTAAEAPKEMGYEEGVLLNLSDFAMKGRVAKRMRAEQILAELDATGEIKDEEPAAKVGGPKMTYDLDDSEKRIRMNDGSSQKVARKRKQRTTVADDDTSADDSSDTESSSEEGSATPSTSQARDESSSSSSSSSSSDSSSDGDESEEDDGEDSDESDSD
ncbi:Uncharacterized protein D0Z07_1071 [Hyphodiscus hymeniophilus]|uniref:WKF domain-containing protein n=1 Tax=Hyphodiscus hymeniophilus TaxID=353542 RepID=A0A9P6VNW9_9HELO|nr:Uncharacterized protein D0Z07_1071 [Hyphodiscus hymeniophilus]